MQAKMTRVLCSALIALALLPLAPVAEAVVSFDFKLMSAAGNAVNGGTLFIAIPGAINRDDFVFSGKANDDDNVVGVVLQDSLFTPKGDANFVLWIRASKDLELVGRQELVIRGGKVVAVNPMLLDYSPGESSYCSPSCDAPSSVVDSGGRFYWIVPTLVGTGLVLLAVGGSDSDGESVNGGSGSGSSSSLQKFVGLMDCDFGGGDSTLFGLTDKNGPYNLEVNGNAFFTGTGAGFDMSGTNTNNNLNLKGTASVRTIGRVPSTLTGTFNNSGGNYIIVLFGPFGSATARCIGTHNATGP